MAKQKAGELTALQTELLQALVESGVSKDDLQRACNALFVVKQEPESERPEPSTSEGLRANETGGALITRQQHNANKSAASDHLQACETVTPDSQVEGESMSFLDQMLRYVYTNVSRGFDEANA